MTIIRDQIAAIIKRGMSMATTSKCNQIADAIVAETPKLSPVSRQAILYGLEELEATTRVRLNTGGEECPELAGFLHANLRAVQAARAELENLP